MDFQEQFDKAMAEYATRNAYGVSKIPAHAHNGVDSFRIVYSDLLSKPLFGTVDSTGKGWYLPAGWTSVKTGTGIYVITHKLNSIVQPSGFYLYNVNITHIGAGVANMFDITFGSNSFTVTTFNGSGTPTDFNFNFVLSLIRN